MASPILCRLRSGQLLDPPEMGEGILIPLLHRLLVLCDHLLPFLAEAIFDQRIEGIRRQPHHGSGYTTGDHVFHDRAAHFLGHFRHRYRAKANILALRGLERPDPAGVVNEGGSLIQLPTVFVHCPLIEGDQNVQSIPVIPHLLGRDAHLVTGMPSLDQGHKVAVGKNVMPTPIQHHGENFTGAVDPLSLGTAHFPSQFCHGLFHLPPALIYNRPPHFCGQRLQSRSVKLSLSKPNTFFN